MASLTGQNHVKVTDARRQAMLEGYSGRLEVYCPSQFFDNFYCHEKRQGLPPPDESLEIRDLTSDLDGEFLLDEFRYSRECLLLKNLSNPNQTALAIYDRQDNLILPLRQGCALRSVNIKPKNVGQKFVLEALMAPVSEVPLVLLSGPAGTGKTLLSLAVGLTQLEMNSYDSLTIWRANIEADRDYGYLPGELPNKTLPFMAPILDNLKVMFPGDFTSTEKDGCRITPDCLEILKKHRIEFGPIGFLQGRSVSRSFIIVDEAQNLTPSQAKMIVSRAASNSKIVFAGDCDQVSQAMNFAYGRETNGLAMTIQAMGPDAVTWNVTMLKSESCRSPLASAAIKRMRDF